MIILRIKVLIPQYNLETFQILPMMLRSNQNTQNAITSTIGHSKQQRFLFTLGVSILNTLQFLRKEFFFLNHFLLIFIYLTKIKEKQTKCFLVKILEVIKMQNLKLKNLKAFTIINRVLFITLMVAAMILKKKMKN